MNRNQLTQTRNGWLQQAGQDLIEKMNAFMRQNGLSQRQAAQELGLSETDVRNIVNGNAGAVSLTGFATLLIVNGLALAIQPVSETPMGRGMRPMAQPQQRQAAPAAAPVRDSRGRFVPRNGGAPMPPPPAGAVPMNFEAYPEAESAAPVVPELDAMSREELVDMVLTNHWEGEIDLIRATRPQIIAFLESKTTPAPVEAPAAEATDATKFAEMLAKELANNPEMLATLMANMGKK